MYKNNSRRLTIESLIFWSIAPVILLVVQPQYILQRSLIPQSQTPPP